MYRNAFRKLSKICVYLAVFTFINLLFFRNIKKDDSFEANSIHKSFIYERLPVSRNKTISSFTDGLDRLINGQITPLHQVKSPSADTINVGIILVNIKKTDKFDYKLEIATRKNIASLIENAKSKPIQLILVTDEFSSSQVGSLVASLIGTKIALDVIKNVYHHKLVQPPFVTIVNYKEIVAKNPEFVHGYMALNVTDAGTKYEHEFFFIAPIYHQAFTNFDRLIMVDGTDMLWQSDIAELNDQYNLFKPENIIGMGNDMSPYYWLNLKDYRAEHPDTELGEPGPLQGLNSGVVLFDLERMRKSDLYNKYLTPAKTKEILNKHKFRPILGDQDWFTNLDFIHPDLFYVLPCEFNAQTSLEYMRAELKNLFDDFHFCGIYQKLKIVHYNGCGMLPISCGHKGDPEQHMSEVYKKGGYDLKVISHKIDWMYFVKNQVARGELDSSVLPKQEIHYIAV